MEALRLDRVSKNFGGLAVLREVSLTVEAGEYVAVICCLPHIEQPCL